jgi:hypothetical protein
MPRESGASSNHRVMGCAPIEATGLLDRPLFAGDDVHVEALIAGRIPNWVEYHSRRLPQRTAAARMSRTAIEGRARSKKFQSV